MRSEHVSDQVVEIRVPRLLFGRWVFSLLLVLSAAEFLMAVRMSSALLWLAAFAVIKAWLILEHFMHLAQLRHREGEEE